MTFYFNTDIQKHANDAYEKGNYELALQHYNTALGTLNRRCTARTPVNAVSLQFDIASVQCDIALVNATIMGKNNPNGLNQEELNTIKIRYTSAYNEAKQIADTELPASEKKIIQTKLNTANLLLIENTGVSYLNRAKALASQEFNQPRAAIKALKQAQEYLQKYYDHINELIFLDSNERKEECKELFEYTAELHDKISDAYVEISDNPNEKLTNRINALKNAIYRNKLAFDIITNVSTEVPVLLHLAYTHLNTSLYKLTNSTEYLIAIEKHMDLHKLDATRFSREEQVEYYGVEFYVTTRLHPQASASVKKLAQKIVDLGSVPDNAELQAFYTAAQQFLTQDKNNSEALEKSSNETHKRSSSFIHESDITEPAAKRLNMNEASASITTNANDGFFTPNEPIRRTYPLRALLIEPSRNLLQGTKEILKKVQINPRTTAFFISIIADSHNAQPGSPEIVMSQELLYRQARAIYDSCIIKHQHQTLINFNKERMPNLVNNLLEPIYFPHFNTSEDLLNNFMKIFESHLLKIEDLIREDQLKTRINHIFTYLAAKIVRYNLLPEAEALTFQSCISEIIEASEQGTALALNSFHS